MQRIGSRNERKAESVPENTNFNSFLFCAKSRNDGWDILFFLEIFKNEGFSSLFVDFLGFIFSRVAAVKSHVIKHKLLLLCRELFAPGLDSHLDVLPETKKGRIWDKGR